MKEIVARLVAAIFVWRELSGHVFLFQLILHLFASILYGRHESPNHVQPIFVFGNRGRELFVR